MHKYLNPRNYTRYFKNRSIQLASTALQPVEKYLAKKYGEQGIRKYPPVFIIGAPRCGSTLLYKVLTERYKFIYFSNFTARFYKIPICGTWLQMRLRIDDQQGNYHFHYGQVQGPASPHECGEFWYRWFPRGMHVYVSPGLTNHSCLKELRDEINGISTVARRPMIFKNLYNSMRIAPIVEATPEASFIVCRRDIRNNTLSILKGREIHMKDKNKWMGTPPKEIDKLINLSNEQQVVGQIHYIYRQIEKDKRHFGSDRFFEIQYEDFCADVHSTIERIEKFLATRGCYLERRYEVPTKFQVKTVNEASPDDRRVVAQAVRNSVGQNNR